jgi:hypothetical protein
VVDVDVPGGIDGEVAGPRLGFAQDFPDREFGQLRPARPKDRHLFGGNVAGVDVAVGIDRDPQSSLKPVISWAPPRAENSAGSPLASKARIEFSGEPAVA